MKLLLLMLSLLALSVSAQVPTKRELVQRSLERMFPEGERLDRKADMDDLVEEWNNIFDRQNLVSDRYKHRTDWKKRFPLRTKNTYRIEGQRVYYKLFPKNYRYTIIENPSSNQLIVRLKLHFYPSKTYIKKMTRLHRTNHENKKYFPRIDELMEKVRKNVKRSQEIWNQQAPSEVRFVFDMVDTAAEADYSVKLVTHMGALYDKFIVSSADYEILAHEIGHMMGLDDEYSPTANVLPVHTLAEVISNKHVFRDFEYTAMQDMKCHLESIMCLRDVVYDYHLDHILGRLPEN